MNEKSKTNSFIGLVFILGSLAAIGPLSIDMYLPAFSRLASDFNVSESQIGYTLTSYFIGISIGQLIFGPLSDRFGRKLPTQIGLTTFFLSSILIAYAYSLEMMIAVRVFMALGGAMGMVTSKAIVRDNFEATEMAKFFSALMLVMGIAPIVAPLLGGFLTDWFGWRSIFIFLSIYTAIIFFSITFFLKETKTPDPSISLKPLPILKDYKTVISQKQFAAYAIAGGMSYAGLFAYISGAPSIFMSYFEFSERAFGILFGMNAAGYIIGAQFNRLALNRFSSQTISRSVILIQLIFMTIAILSWVFQIGFLYIGIAALWFFLFCLGFITPNTTTLALSPFKKFSGSASALIGSIGMFLGATITGVVSTLGDGTPAPVIKIMFVCASISASIMWIYAYMTPSKRFSEVDEGL